MSRRSRSTSRDRSYRRDSPVRSYRDNFQHNDYDDRRRDSRRRDDYRDRRDDYRDRRDSYNDRRDDYNDRRDDRRDDYNDRRDDYRGGYNDRRDDYRRPQRQNTPQKHLEPISYDVSTLPPITKDFYKESDITKQRTQEEIDNYLKGYNITLSGAEKTSVLLTFDEINFPDYVKKVFVDLKYEKPTPIQAVGWPIVLSGKDVVGVAETGSGKTISFLIPAILHLMSTPLAQYREGPRVLVMAPTRELVCQITEEAEKFTRGTGIKVCSVYGGASVLPQVKKISNGCDICVATPGRLIDFISRGTTKMDRCTFLVIDEADRMLDMGFENDMKDIIGQIRPDRQTVMWTATWPKDIQNFAMGFMFRPLQINVGNPDLHANENVKQVIEVCSESERYGRMLDIINKVGKDTKILIFAKTKKNADYLSDRIRNDGISVGCMHGDKPQFERDRVLGDFKSGRISCLVATDVCSRGLDIKDIQVVINYEFPQDIDSYIHRIGRTGRMGRSVEGVAYSLFTNTDERLSNDLITVLKSANQTIPAELERMTRY
ncbi:RNA helicase [Entamoeba marina]